MEELVTRRKSHRLAIGVGAVIVLVAAAVIVGLISQSRDGNAQSKAAKTGKGKKGAPEAQAAAPVELAAVERGSISTYLQTTTTLEARNSATLVARRQGQVTQLLAEEG